MEWDYSSIPKMNIVTLRPSWYMQMAWGLLDARKNTTYIEKCHEFGAVSYILNFTKKRTLAYTTKQSRISLKKGVFCGASMCMQHTGLVMSACGNHIFVHLQPQRLSMAAVLAREEQNQRTKSSRGPPGALARWRNSFHDWYPEA